MDQWAALDTLHSGFANIVQENFRDPGQFLASLESEADTHAAVLVAMQGTLKPDEIQALAAGVWRWKLRAGTLEKRTILPKQGLPSWTVSC